MGKTLESNLFGKLPIRPESARMMADFGKVLSLLVDAEVLEDLAGPDQPQLTKEQVSVRERLIQTLADTKGAAQALLAALGDRSTWMLPHLSVSRKTVDEHPVTSLDIFACENIENTTLNSILRWALNNVSDAPYAQYQFRLEELHNDNDPEVIEESFAIVTREQDYVFCDAEDFDDLATKLDRAWAAQQRVAGLPHDPSSNAGPAAPGGI
ncbi:hypothetical protein [Alcanivorax sp. 1008]|uniref:hypothetical protein n=1 Tax=Alcanivorax sp. 1008 TaxID=2816853 RepID=UPI001D210450|nr:hypothetical protein [Alcanivorax sp. 1008]MCC1496877.1 hypothetical protein [Alcanivorax sp. 1008]